MKTCYKCHVAKPFSEFHLNSHKRDGLSTYCKMCAKIRNAAYYVATPERNAQRNISRNKAVTLAKDFVWGYLTSHPCVDCQNSNPVVLEFDHIRDKNYNISNMVSQGMGVDTIAKEIEKCEVRCANCHRIVTSQRGNWYAGPQ